MKIDKENICFVGDIHGNFESLVYQVTYRYDIKDSALILVGDCGLGFCKPEYYERLYKRLSERLEKNNNIILCIRGNHDNPDYYTEQGKLDFPRLKSIPDYTVLEISNYTILVVGGARSIDKEERIKCDSQSGRTTWWEKERPEKIDLKKLPVKVDVVVSHEAPIQFLPVVTREDWMTLETWNSIIEDRDYLGEIEKELLPKHWIHGHYHKSDSGTYRDTLYRCLAIDEIWELPKKEVE